MSAFTGESDNTKQLSSVSKTLTNAVNKHGSTSETFLFNKKTVIAIDEYGKRPSYKIYKWDLYKMEASAGVRTGEILYTKGTLDAEVCFEYRTISTTELLGTLWKRFLVLNLLCYEIIYNL